MDHTDDVNLARRETPFLALLNAVFSCAAKMVDDPRLSVGEGLDDAGMGMVYYERYASKFVVPSAPLVTRTFFS